MTELCSIPLKYKSGVFALSECETDAEEKLAMQYQEGGDILMFKIPDYEYKYIRLYGVPKDELESTLRASYDNSGNLNKITATIKNKEMLLYIHYEDAEDTRQKIQQFATENADIMIKTICQCEETVSRLFIEYFDDGEYIDIHVKIGTQKRKLELEKQYPDYANIVDNCGDYGADIVTGDNDRLKVLLLCTDDDEMDYLHLAVDTTVARIKEKALEKLKKANDFKIICVEYD